MFDPKTNKYPYTEYTDGHYIKIKKDDKTVFDKNYSFVEKGFSFKFKQFFFLIFYRLIVFPVVVIRMGLKVKGRKNLKKHKALLKNGVISICNHVHYWDFIGLSIGIRPYFPYYLVWANNVRGSLGGAMKLIRGLPIPDNNLGGTLAFTKSVKDILVNKKGWLHIFAEGSMWEYYKPIRPFKAGAATYACKYDKPIIPLAYTYRKPGWIRRKIFKQIALYTLNIGEPIFPNYELNKEEQIKDLTIRAHQEVCKLANIKEGENIYPPIFDQTKRIDY